jgi:hypothetical protein
VEGSRDSLQGLEKMVKEVENEDIKSAAQSQIERIKEYWITVSKTKGAKLEHGGVKPSDLKTNVLINDLLQGGEWAVRALAAQHLGERKEKGVPEALLQSIDKDKHLQVVGDALRAFDKVTGYDCPDVFGRGIAQEWWNENSKKVNATLADQQ